MPNTIDLSWVQKGREMEVEAIDGGRASNEFTLSPVNQTDDDFEEMPVNTRSVDDAEETEERIGIVKNYVTYARSAFTERGLTYPFRESESGDSLVVLPGPDMRDLAVKTANLCRIISTKGKPSKEFETRGFKALHAFIGGTGACVGATRGDGTGPKRAVEKFRGMLHFHEQGTHHEKYENSGDLGADGFIILGRPWVGPLVYYQSKNTPFDLRGFPTEFARLNGVVQAWFGRSMSNQRPVLSVLAANTLLTMAAREDIFHTQGGAAVMIIDAADILRAELGDLGPPLCTIF